VVDPPFEYDVQKRIPNVSKAQKQLGFVAEVSLEQAVREVVAWCRTEIEAGRL
jgi:UDP-glucose 4-epimerase